MARSDLLRVQDVRDGYRLIGECGDRGGDPELWHPRMLEGICQLIGGPLDVRIAQRLDRRATEREQRDPRGVDAVTPLMNDAITRDWCGRPAIVVEAGRVGSRVLRVTMTTWRCC